MCTAVTFLAPEIWQNVQVIAFQRLKKLSLRLTLLVGPSSSVTIDGPKILGKLRSHAPSDGQERGYYVLIIPLT